MHAGSVRYPQSYQSMAFCACRRYPFPLRLLRPELQMLSKNMDKNIDVNMITPPAKSARPAIPSQEFVGSMRVAA